MGMLDRDAECHDPLGDSYAFGRQFAPDAKIEIALELPGALEVRLTPDLKLKAKRGQARFHELDFRRGFRKNVGMRSGRCEHDVTHEFGVRPM